MTDWTQKTYYWQHSTLEEYELTNIVDLEARYILAECMEDLNIFCTYCLWKQIGYTSRHHDECSYRETLPSKDIMDIIILMRGHDNE